MSELPPAERNCDVLYDPKTDGNGTYCCPVCLYWYKTREDKTECIKRHGYEILVVGPKMNLKGYVSVRLPVPVAVQNLVLRDYCARNGHTYFLADVEYVIEGSYVMLRGMRDYDFPGIVAYSMFMAPQELWPADKEIHFALENYILPRDRETVEAIWKLK